MESEREEQERRIREHKDALRIREEMRLDGRPGDRLIRVMAPFNQAAGYRPQTFVLADVACVAGGEVDRSAIVLRSGAEIPVALPYTELEQKIYRPDFSTDGPVLDLREVTGEVAKPKEGFRTPRIWP